MQIKSVEDLNKVREEAQAALRVRAGGSRAQVVVAMGTCGIAAGARAVITALMDELAKRNLVDVVVTQSGCKGLCDREPMVEVAMPGLPTVVYGDITPERMRTIVGKHLVNGAIIGEWTIGTA